MKVMGLDLSLTGTGLVIVDEDGTLVVSELLKSKPSGDRPLDELVRIQKIVGRIEAFIEEHSPSSVFIENLAFMARNTTALVQLSGLSFMVRDMLSRRGIPFFLIAPTSLKKFITSSGKGDKNLMLLEVYKQYNHSFLEDNTCDSFCLCACGLAFHGKPINKLTVGQKDVIKLLEKQV
jgi:Holliday junction resolvasome RuvABC endonuclease subunit